MLSKYDYRKINYEVMTDTKHQCETNEELKHMVQYSVGAQIMVSHEDNIDQPLCESNNTEYIVTGGRSFATAQCWAAEGCKVAVLNFANNHSIGGAPFSAGAQEESLCHCSTLYPCLQAMEGQFYEKHRRHYEAGEMSYMGNDDLIYTPKVCVFKTDPQTDPIIPKMMPRDKWYMVDVITSAAPQLRDSNSRPSDYEVQIGSRIKKILDAATMQGVNVLILGAWGCGAFRNPEDIVARVFHAQLKHYNFKKVVFALGRRDYENSAFYKEFSGYISPEGLKTINLLRSTGRDNIENVIEWMKQNNFFEAPASVNYHNNFRGGLVKHSLEVYEEAIKLNAAVGLPLNSIIITALLHDICKADKYILTEYGNPTKNSDNIKKEHGRRSMFILKRGCQLPLNYDEEMAIWWHMGEHEVSKDKFSKEYQDSMNIELCNLIRQADGKAAKKAMETTPDNSAPK